jgi:hypothetical protein
MKLTSLDRWGIAGLITGTIISLIILAFRNNPWN